MKHVKILFLLLFAVISTQAISAYSFKFNGICYQIVGDRRVSVTYQNNSSPRYSNLSGAITIPYTVKYGSIQYTVVEIDDYAFSGCTGLTSVRIPNSVTSIGRDSFRGCTGLASLTIGNSVASIGKYAFYGCADLASVNIPNSVISIGEHAFDGCKGLISLTIGNSVTSIGEYTFDGCSGLTSVDIPNSVTSIGRYAFYGCKALTSLTIGNSVTSIGSYAFSGCSGLTSVDIPNSVTSIGDYAFYGCKALTSLTIGNSVTSIGVLAFTGCKSLTSVTIPTSVTAIEDYAFSGCTGLITVNWNAKSVVNYGSSPFNDLTNVKSFIIGNEVEKLPNGLCAGLSGLNSVTIGNSVTSIGEHAFDGCSGLTSIDIPNSVTSIGSYAFSGCSGLTSVTISSSVKSIGGAAFSYCSDLEKVTINSDKIMSRNYYYNNSNDRYNIGDIFGLQVKQYIIGNSVTKISINAFTDCTDLTSVTIGNSVKTIDEYAFSSCSNLKNITFEDGEETLNVVALSFIACPIEVIYLGRPIINNPFRNNQTLNMLTIGNSVFQIADYSFENCHNLSSVTTGNSVTSIGNNAFSGCTGLNSVTIGNSVTSIGNNAFSGCTGLNSVHINSLSSWCKISFANDYSQPLNYAHHLYIDGEEVTDLIIPNDIEQINTCVFSGCTGLTSLTIHNSVTSIGNNAFSGCIGLTSLTIPNSVTSIGKDSFRGCTGLNSVHINSLSSWCKISFANDYSQPLNYAHHLYIDGEEVTDLIIPNDIEQINTCAFRGCTGLNSLTISSSVKSIGSSAFNGCTGLTSVTIPRTVRLIGDSAFYACTSLENVTINSNEILSKNYSSSSNIGNIFGLQVKQYIIGNSVTSIGKYTFSGCTGLTSVIIPNSVTSIGDFAFSNCSGFSGILTIPNSVASIGRETFYKCSSLTTVIIPNSVNSIGLYAFSGCSSLRNLVIEDDTNSLDIDDSGFKECPLYQIYIGRDLGSNARRYFMGKTTLKYVTIGNLVTKIDDVLFSDCPNLSSVTIGNSVTSIGEYAFYGCSSLTSVTIPNSVTSIGHFAFRDCSGLRELIINDGMETLNVTTKYPSSVSDPQAGTPFMNCDLDTLYLGRNIHSTDSYILAFYDSYIRNLIIGPYVTSITSCKFDYYEELGMIHSLNPNPPNMFIYTFEEKTYNEATLYVPIGSISSYKQHPYWKQFFKIIEKEYSSIDDIVIDPSVNPLDNPNEIKSIYTIDGRRLNPHDVSWLPNGLYIINGKKVLIKR